MRRFRSMSLSLAALAVLIGVGAVAARGAMAQTAGTPRFSAHQIADAVLFSEGEAANYLESLRRGPTPWTPEIREIQRDIHVAMAEDQYYVRGGFAEAMQSGDPKAVNAALTYLGGTVRRLLDQRYGPLEVDKALMAIDALWGGEKLVSGAIFDHHFTRVVESHFNLDEDLNTQFSRLFFFEATTAVIAVVATVVVVVAAYFSDLRFSGRTRLAQEIFLAGVATGLRYDK